MGHLNCMGPFILDFFSLYILHMCTRACCGFSRVQLFVTQWTIAHQALLSIEFSRQEYCSGFPCPPPGDLSDPGMEPESPMFPALQTDSLPSESPGKPKNTRVGSLSLLQRIFLAQELNWCLLHFRHVLYQMSYQGSPS